MMRTVFKQEAIAKVWAEISRPPCPRCSSVSVRVKAVTWNRDPYSPDIPLWTISCKCDMCGHEWIDSLGAEIGERVMRAKSNPYVPDRGGV